MEIRVLHRRGMSIRAIARELKMSCTTVRKHAAQIVTRTFNGTSRTTREQLDPFNSLDLSKPSQIAMLWQKPQLPFSNINRLRSELSNLRFPDRRKPRCAATILKAAGKVG